jgi:hypothetical protein
MALPKLFKQLTDHMAAYDAHGATSIATANRLVLRDSSGRSKISEPIEDDDIATKKK